jgi:hypothetical protein
MSHTLVSNSTAFFTCSYAIQWHIQEYVNIEEDEDISHWESPQALAILQRDIEDVDPNKVKLVSAHVNLMNLSFRFVPLHLFFSWRVPFAGCREGSLQHILHQLHT